jgi:hypothetical protein
MGNWDNLRRGLDCRLLYMYELKWKWLDCMEVYRSAVSDGIAALEYCTVVQYCNPLLPPLHLPSLYLSQPVP